MFGRFTRKARQVVAGARREAQALGVLHGEDFTSARLAIRAGADVKGLRAAVTRLLTPETARP